MELRQLNYFVKSAEYENFSQAAQECYVVQSTLSQQIKQLENDLGVLLFDRIGKKVVLTEEGKAFLPLARAILNTADEGRQQIKDIKQLRSGHLHIAVTYGLSVLLTQSLQRFCPHYPNVQFDIRFEKADDILKLLLNREIDIALSYGFPSQDPEIEATTLFGSHLCALVDRSHPLSNRSEISLSELNDYQVAIPAKGMNSRRMLDELLCHHPTDLHPLIEINEIYTMIHMVHSCHIVALHTDSSVFEEDDVVSLPIKESRQPMQAYLLQVKGAYRRRAVEEFIRCIKCDNLG